MVFGSESVDFVSDVAGLEAGSSQVPETGSGA